MTHSLRSALVLAVLTTAAFAQQAVPESPAIWREVSNVNFTDPANRTGPAFTRPHLPAFRTTADGRIGTIVEGGGVDYPAFTLFIPEKMTQPFLLNPASSFTMTKDTPLPSDFVRINVANSYTTAPSNSQQYTDGVQGSWHVTIWDPGSNPTVVANEDVYNIKVFVCSNAGGITGDRMQYFVTPIKITVANPKTTSASIRLVEKTGPTIAGPQFSFGGFAFEPVIVGDGRLLVIRIGAGSMPWTNPNTGLAGSTSGQGFDMVYSYYPGGNAADPAQWTNLIPITYAPYDNRINTKFGFAMAPFRDAEGTPIPPGADLGATYPWIDRAARNLFCETVTDTLSYYANGSYNNSRYPMQPNGNEPADFTQPESGGHEGISFMGLWSHGKMVMIDNLNNAIDYGVGSGNNSATGEQHRLVSLFQPNSGPLGTENGQLLFGYGRATTNMPPGENDNGNIIDSIENLFNYRKHAVPLRRNDVVWPLSNSANADEVVFDDYTDPDAFIVAHMNGLRSYSGGHQSGWNYATNTFGLAVKLQNAATSTADRWIVPKHGLVIGNGRLEPAATGGVHGKGFSMDGNIGLEFTVEAQPAGVVVTNHSWYAGLFVDCRFADDTAERQLLTFPDGTGVRLYGRSQVLYTDASGAVIHRITLPAAITGTNPLDDLLPDTGWAHLGFQIRDANTKVDLYLNGLPYNRWADGYETLFKLTPGKLTVGRLAAGGLAGFAGWIDEFKVLAHAVDYETACNHANGSLIGLSANYTGDWNAKFASRYPAWVHTEISNFLKNQGETSYPLYASFYNYRADNAAHRNNVPTNTVSLRLSVHFPEGPLFHNRPRPDTASNAFCASCHHAGANGGLDLAALKLNTSFNASTDPRRQPSQPPPRLYGRIPAGLVDSTNLPATTTNLTATGKLTDQWMLAAFSNKTAVQSFTVVDAATHRDLMTLTAGSVVDPAKIGTANLTFRANLDSAQGNVVLKLDALANNTKTKPPYTAFGTVASPWVGTTLTPGAHTLQATPQYGTAVSVGFTVAGGATRELARYSTDFQAGSPKSGWSYWWNALGNIGNPANYRQLAWNSATGVYTANGFPNVPDNSSALFPYGMLGAGSGHPGRGVNQTGADDRYPIAAYTAKLAGYYGINSSSVTVTNAASNGGAAFIATETNSGATFMVKTNSAFSAVTTFTFNQNVGYLAAGDTIYVGVGPNADDGSDSFNLDFSIVFNESVNPL